MLPRPQTHRQESQPERQQERPADHEPPFPQSAHQAADQAALHHSVDDSDQHEEVGRLMPVEAQCPFHLQREDHVKHREGHGGEPNHTERP